MRAQAAACIVAGFLCGFAFLALAQTQSTGTAAPQSTAPQHPISIESEPIVIPVEVIHKKAWKKAVMSEQPTCVKPEGLIRRTDITPNTLSGCVGVYVRGLTTKDFHLLVDGVEHAIQSVAEETEMIGVREERGFRYEYSWTPVGKWSTLGFHLHTRKPTGSWGDFGGWPQFPRAVYNLSFLPANSNRTGCHKIQVTVDQKDSIVHYRNEYCNGQSARDTLRGTDFSNRLERDLASGEPEKFDLSLQSGVFRTDTDKGLVRIALKIPSDSLARRWHNDWTLHATIGVLGIVYSTDGSAAARFSDLGCCASYFPGGFVGWYGETVDDAIAMDSDTAWSLYLLTDRKKPELLVNPTVIRLHGIEQAIIPAGYETQLDLGTGEYDLRIVLSDGEKFGRAEAHLNIEKYDDKALALSSVMLCKRYRDAHVAAVERAAANFAPQYVPMVSKGMEVAPAGDTTFGKDDPLIPYFEIYEPLLASQPDTRVEARIRILDAKTGEVVKDFPPVNAAPYMNPGSTTIPVARQVPIEQLPIGAYCLEVQASDSAGRSTEVRTADFTVE